MKIDGGINQYNFKRKRHLVDELPYGRRVIFLNMNGYDYQKEKAREFFVEGQILTVKEIYVYEYSSTVEFIECPNIFFNTAMFADYLEENLKEGESSIESKY